MDWIKRMNAAVNYIEGRIMSDLDFAEIAKVAHCSMYHFQRMFNCMTGMPLSEYIRRRRMSLAAVDLQSGSEKIIDVALKYGYNSPTAFNRAFQSVHGIAPSLVKQEGASVKSYSPINFKITITGTEGLNYRIEKKDAFRVVGVSVELERELENSYELVSQMWRLAAANGTTSKLTAMRDGQPAGLMTVMVCNDTIEQWRCYAAVSSTKKIDGTLEEYTVPPYTWAIFPGEGKDPEAIWELWRKVIDEFLATSGYEYDNGPDIEVYFNDDPLNTKFELWVPVRSVQYEEDA